MATTFTVKSKSHSYKIIIKEGSLSQFAQSLEALGLSSNDFDNLIFVCDTNTQKIARDLSDQLATKYRISQQKILTIPAGEDSKSLKQCDFLWNGILEFGLGRNAILIAVGGGVVGDLVGFVAGTHLRGVKYIQIPTTLMSQVDSSIGGKVGINLENGKNLVGLFNPPLAVVIDPEILTTLPVEEIRNGLVEIVKIGLLFDPELYQEVIELKSYEPKKLALLIEKAVALKIKVVTADETENTGERIFLNLGHTIGHALESGCNFKGISHGQAVALGIILETKLLGEQDLYQRLIKEFKEAAILNSNIELNIDTACQAIVKDKKVVKKDTKKETKKVIKIPVISKIGQSSIKEVEAHIITEFLKTEGLLPGLKLG